MKKENYLIPRIEVIEVENEGVMAFSMKPGGELHPNPTISSRSSSSTRGTAVETSSAFSDLEDIINDIFTVKK